MALEIKDIERTCLRITFLVLEHCALLCYQGVVASALQKFDPVATEIVGLGSLCYCLVT